MSVRRHRIAAAAILLCGCLGVGVAARRLMADPPATVHLRDALAGRWVATRVATTAHNSIGGPDAAGTTVEFRGREVHFRGLVDAPRGDGVINFEPGGGPTRFDCRLDAGWLRGTMSLRGDTLVLCTNALKLSEQLGVPTRGWPDALAPALGRYVYEFRRAAP